jgi:hypothetical protein
MSSSLSPEWAMSLSLGCKLHQTTFGAKSSSIAPATKKGKKPELKGKFGMGHELEHKCDRSGSDRTRSLFVVSVM